MNRMIRGMAGLMVALGASACADDPSVEFGGDAPTKVQATPTVMIINQGAREELLLRLVDDRNRSTPTSWEISNVGAGITVELDDEYRPDYIGSDELEFNPIQHQHRYYVTANEPVGTQFTVSSGGISQVIKVNVVPSEIPAAASGGNGTTEPSQLTSDNFLFDENTTFALDGVPIPYLGASEDGHTANIIIPAGQSGELTVTGARASYMPTVALPTLPLSSEVTGPAGGAQAGTGDPGTAPTITLNGFPFGFVDVGAFGGPDYLGNGNGSTTKIYHLHVPEDLGDVDISLNWIPGDDSIDLDLFLADGGFNAILGSAENGNNADHPPEVVTHDLPAGDYFLFVLNWRTFGTPSYISITFTPH